MENYLVAIVSAVVSLQFVAIFYLMRDSYKLKKLICAVNKPCSCCASHSEKYVKQLSLIVDMNMTFDKVEDWSDTEVADKLEELFEPLETPVSNLVLEVVDRVYDQDDYITEVIQMLCRHVGVKENDNYSVDELKQLLIDYRNKGVVK